MKNTKFWRWKLGSQCGQTFFTCDDVSARTLPMHTFTNQPVTIFIDVGRRRNSLILWVTAQQRVAHHVSIIHCCLSSMLRWLGNAVLWNSLLGLQQLARHTAIPKTGTLLYPAQEQTTFILYLPPCFWSEQNGQAQGRSLPVGLGWSSEHVNQSLLRNGLEFHSLLALFQCSWIATCFLLLCAAHS